FSLGPTLQLPFATFAFSIAPVFGAAASDLVFSPPTEPAPLVARARGDGSWDPPVPLTSATAFPAGFGNSPLTPAKLGGAAPGRDLITIDVNGNLAYPFIRDDATHPLQVTLLAPVAPPSNCFLLSPLREMPDVDGDGFGDLIATCAGPTLQVARSDGKGAALSFGAWETVATSPNGDDFSMVSDRRLLSGRVPFVLSNFSVSPTLQVGTFLWTGSGWASSFTDTHLSWDTTIMGLDVVSLSPGTQSVVLFTVAGAYAFSEQAGGSLGAQRKLGASGQAYLVLAPGAGAPPDILGIPNPFASTLEGALFVNAGDGTFP
ncbi:MAG: hypothetical protein ACXWLM_11680, partial [Myxococcales bacterium]